MRSRIPKFRSDSQVLRMWFFLAVLTLAAVLAIRWGLLAPGSVVPTDIEAYLH